MEGRLPTGVPGLDEMIGGGWIIPSSVLVAGAPGTGKTTFAIQSLFEGARKGETTAYFTGISEPGWVVQQFLRDFSFYDQALVDDGKIAFIDIGAAVRRSAQEALDQIQKEIEKLNPTRVAIDPVTVFKTSINSDKLYREMLHDLTSFMKAFNSVVILTAEFDYDDKHSGVEGFMVDGVIVLSQPREGHVRRKYLEVVKMRGTKHLTGEQIADLNKNGFIVQPGLR